jgi:hypothetical protein
VRIVQTTPHDVPETALGDEILAANTATSAGDREESMPAFNQEEVGRLLTACSTRMDAVPPFLSLAKTGIRLGGAGC